MPLDPQQEGLQELHVKKAPGIGVGHQVPLGLERLEHLLCFRMEILLQLQVDFFPFCKYIIQRHTNEILKNNSKAIIFFIQAVCLNNTFTFKPAGNFIFTGETS